MKWLHVIPDLNPQSGGTAMFVRSIAAAQAQVGDEVAVLSLDQGENQVEIAGVSRIRLKAGKGKYRHAPELAPWLDAHASAYDAVVVHGIWQYHSLAVYLSCSRTGTPYFVFPHGMLDPWFKRAYPAKHLKKWLYWPLGDYRVLKYAARVIFTEESEMKLARQSFALYEAREEVCTLGIEDPPDYSRQPLPDWWPKDEPGAKNLKLLFLGRLDPKKACDLFLKAVGCLRNKTKVRVILAGPDSVGWQKDLERIAKQSGLDAHVLFPGPLAGTEKWKVLEAVDALVLPSYQENFGLVVAEAAAVGTPALLSTGVNIWREQVENGAALASEPRVENLAAMLDSFCDLHDEERSAMRKCARDSFLKRYRISQCVERLRTIVSGAI